MFLTLYVCFFAIILVRAEITIYVENSWLENYVERDCSNISFPHFHIPYKKGVIDIGDPVDGCSPLRNTSGLDISLNHFVLIGPNGCTDETKVLNAQNRGYAAALVAQSDNSMNEDKLLSEIPILLISKHDYEEIRDMYVSSVSPSCRVTITFGEQEFVLAMAISFVLIILAIASFIFLLSTYKNSVVQKVHGYWQRIVCPDLSKLRICAICQDPMMRKSKVRQCSPCLHAFHNECIMNWIKTVPDRPTCPYCRKDILDSHEITEKGEPTEATPLLQLN